MEDLDTRIIRAREANLALYLDDPSPDSATLLLMFERTVLELKRAERTRQAEEKKARLSQ